MQHTGRAVLAFRKVNQMSWNEKATGKIFKKLADGPAAASKVKHPGSGKHVELDISRQILVLAKGGKTKEIYHHVHRGGGHSDEPTGNVALLPQGAGLQQPSACTTRSTGTAATRRTATTRFPPTRRATAAPRNPEANSKHIYDWIDLGDLIHVDPLDPGPGLTALPASVTRLRRAVSDPRQTLIDELREHALVIGEVTLTSGKTASYYVDAKRAILRQPAFGAVAELVAAIAGELGASRRRRHDYGRRPDRERGADRGGRRGSDRLLRPQGEEATWPTALGRGTAARAGHAPCSSSRTW